MTIQRDATAPVVSYDSVAAGTVGSNGWYTSDVTANFTATDALSGPATASATATSSGEGNAVTVESPAFTDNAGNTTYLGAVTHTYMIDKSAPSTPTFIGGPAEGSSYYFGNDPAAPTCAASDAVSGLASCVVSGGGTAVGPHSNTATATDNAGNTSTATLNYSVLAWTLKGYYQPVDLSGVWNTVKGGSTVPAKLQLKKADGTVAQANTDPQWLTPLKGSATSAPVDETVYSDTATSGATYRWDSTAQQYIYNWSTKGTATGYYYRVGVTLDDGQTYYVNIGLR